MATKLDGKRVAFLVTDGFEQVELTGPKEALEKAGALCEIVSPKAGKVKGWKTSDWGNEIPVDVALSGASVERYDALVLPGGVMNPDKLRVLPEARQFVKAFFEAKKPVGAICHGAWTLIDAGVAKGRHMTSWPTLKTDLENAGVRWTDAEVVVDSGLVTSRKPDDIPAFSAKLVEEIPRKGVRIGRRTPRTATPTPTDYVASVS